MFFLGEKQYFIWGWIPRYEVSAGQWIRAGICGWLPKDASSDVFRQAVGRVSVKVNFDPGHTSVWIFEMAVQNRN